MKSQDDGGRGPGGSDRGVTLRYITKKSLVTSAWRPPKQPDNISCFSKIEFFAIRGAECWAPRARAAWRIGTERVIGRGRHGIAIRSRMRGRSRRSDEGFIPDYNPQQRQRD